MENLIDINELAQRLCIAKGTIYNWVSQQRIPFKKIGRCLRFDWKEIEEKWLRRSTIKTAGSKG